MQKKVDEHIIRKLSYWESFFSKPLEQRIFSVTKEMLDYIDLDNQINKYADKPKSVALQMDFIIDVRRAIAEIPESVKALLKDRWAGVFFVEDLGGTGFTDYIFDPSGKSVAAFVVLDAKILQKATANNWATWKESTPFKKDSEYRIEIKLEQKLNDNRKNAIQYILLHELGHVVSTIGFIHPPWAGIKPNQIVVPEKYPFFNESWLVDYKENKYKSKFDSSSFRNRKDIVYYFGAKLLGREMLKSYEQLEETSFVSLYALTNPSDDWAESFATYIHTVLMKKPYEIKITQKGKTVKTIGICWGTHRCVKKEAILARLLSQK